MFKVNIRYRRRSGVFIVHFEHILLTVLVFLLLTLSMYLQARKNIRLVRLKGSNVTMKVTKENSVT